MMPPTYTRWFLTRHRGRYSLIYLRQSVYAAKQFKLKGCSHINAAFAIDRSHRDHLKNISIICPPTLITLSEKCRTEARMFELWYENYQYYGSYTLHLRGVKQSFPSSPSFLHLFYNGVDDGFGTDFVGAVRGT